MQKLQPQDHTGQVEAEGGTERIQARHWEVPESPGQSQAWVRETNVDGTGRAQSTPVSLYTDDRSFLAQLRQSCWVW